MFQKLRKDLLDKLNPIRLLLINADLLLSESRIVGGFSGRILSNGNMTSELRELGIESVAFSAGDNGLISRLVLEYGMGFLYMGVSDKVRFFSDLKTKHAVTGGKISFLTRDTSDMSIIKNVNLSVAAADAPLQVKSESYYVSCAFGQQVVHEVGGLMLKAKKYPDGWSE